MPIEVVAIRSARVDLKKYPECDLDSRAFGHIGDGKVGKYVQFVLLNLAGHFIVKRTDLPILPRRTEWEFMTFRKNYQRFLEVL